MIKLTQYLSVGVTRPVYINERNITYIFEHITKQWVGESPNATQVEVSRVCINFNCATRDEDIGIYVTESLEEVAGAIA